MDKLLRQTQMAMKQSFCFAAGCVSLYSFRSSSLGVASFGTTSGGLY